MSSLALNQQWLKALPQWCALLLQEDYPFYNNLAAKVFIAIWKRCSAFS